MLRLRLLLIILLLPALACKLPRVLLANPTATPPPTETPTHTSTPSPTFTPSATPSPTATPSPSATLPSPPTEAAAPPSEAPQPTMMTTAPATTPAPVTEPPPPTSAPPITPGIPTPEAGAMFSSTFEFGRLSFRIGDKSDSVLPKTLRFKGVPCKEGGRADYWIDFDPSPEYLIVDHKFVGGYDNNMIIFFGQFQGRDRVLGNLTAKLTIEGQTCTVGPIPYAATPGK